jgi:hypothetical protein
MTMRAFAISVAAAGVTAALLSGRAVHRSPPLIVHEWGTITTRHAPNGTPQGRLNRISASEELPPFVHRYEPAPTRDSPEKSLVKTTLTPGRPDVTMRLETPVLYFYPPAGSPSLPPFDVTVRFRGGVVNEFYPNAEPSVVVDVERINAKMRAGVIPPAWTGDVLDNYVVGRLLWRSISLKDTVAVARTSSNVWLAPRRVRSTGVVSGSGESERYLFYRGVAHLDALVQTELTAAEVRLRAPQRLQWMPNPTMTISHLWLVDIRPDHSAAFREHQPITIAKGSTSQELASISLFSARDYGADKLTALRREMKRSLMEAGLYEDEAEAMLQTWKASYFEAPGLRIFYIVPDEWLGYFLPVHVSVPHELKRVLVGRIDLLRGATN